MKKLIYYITDHGRGHATRSVAIIRELQKLNVEVVVRNSNVKDFLTKSLPNTKVLDGITDTGPTIGNDGMSIDEEKTKLNVGKWIMKLDNIAKQECEIISKIKPNLIISDISVMPFLAAKKTHIDSMAISNFSWFDVLKLLSNEQLELLKNAYDYADFAIQLPIGTSMDHFKIKKKVGLVARVPRKSRQELRRDFGIKDSEFAVLFALGGSKKEIQCTVDKNIKILSMNSTIKNNNVIDFSECIEGQEVVSASDLVICKCGYGMISECLTNGIPFHYVANDNHLEQKAMSKELSNYESAHQIKFEEISELELTERYLKSLQRIQIPIDTKNVIKFILEFLNN